MEKVKVVFFQVFGDGGTIEYRDIHKRRYYVQAAKQKDKRVYAEYPRPLIGLDSFRDTIALEGIELEIIETFNNENNL
jgi:hypothetical protein